MPKDLKNNQKVFQKASNYVGIQNQILAADKL